MKSRLDDSIGALTTLTSRNMIRFLTYQLKDYDITPEQWAVLKRLDEANGISQRDLSEKTDKDQATITRILDILERKELVERKQNSEDRRSYLIHITNTGQQLRAKLIPIIENLFEDHMLKDIDKQQLKTFQMVLQQMNENISKGLNRGTKDE